MKKYIFFFLCIFSLSFNTKAQDGLEALLLADNADRSKLINAYVNPAMKGLIYGMSSGWYHTAKVHKSFGFDISIGLNASIVPEADEMFKFSDLNLSSVTSVSSTAATVAGSEDQKPIALVSFQEGGNTYTTQFTMPGGAKESLPLNAIPTPAVQVNLGLPGKFEANLRLVPKVGNDDVKGSLLGIGIKKEITSWFGPMEKTPLHVSLLAAYTSMNVDYDIQNGSSVSGSNQAAEFKLNSYTVQALASLNFPIINIYGGLGYTSGSSTLKMLGTYKLDYNGGLTRTLTDPLNSKFNASGFTTTVGARLSLGFFKVFGSYSLQEYNTANLGIAFSIR
ncbi:hypothetical protein MC378_13365 [Polaribacter sp. MSW13]|uniref:Outer membrane protein beta-barrel domain-containing protein n=1 Tax=Polaribacter marinus TaxID=2916838 RepID=A0A9X1VV48_9FLAO|nr:DUF6588 family protein [Polaribacter marinus]MCI2230161.1 hypothetical protein [Polaribacter marinus]